MKSFYKKVGGNKWCKVYLYQSTKKGTPNPFLVD